MLEGESLSVLDEVLSVAEHRDALAADVARLRADIEMFQRSASQAEQTRRDLAAEVARLREALAASEARATKAEGVIAEALAVTEGMCGQPRATLAFALAGVRMALTSAAKGAGR